MNRTRTEAFDSIKTRQLIYQNPDGSFPSTSTVLAVSDNNGHTVWSSDISVNSIIANSASLTSASLTSATIDTLNTFEINLNAGRLTYANYGGLMVNDVSVVRKYEQTFYSAKHMFPTTSVDVSSIFVMGGYCGGVLAPNGKIYFVPRVASTGVLVINPELNTVSTLPITTFFVGSSPLWFGAVLGPNGRIFAIPYNTNSILVIDTATDTLDRIPAATGPAKWAGGVLGINGKIYGIPFARNQILVIDPSTYATSYVGSPTGWIGGVLGPTGHIYGIPFNSNDVLVINTSTDTYSTFPSGAVGSAKWQGGVLGPNGQIYGMPFNTASILMIDPIAGTANPAAILVPTAVLGGWVGAVLGMNGKIYAIPANGGQVLIIDGTTVDVVSLPVPAGSTKWAGGVLTPGGSIYGTPNSASSVLIIRPGLPTLPPWMLAPEFNKL
jgi:hypothetical protein